MIKKLLSYDRIYYNETPPINLSENYIEKTNKKAYILFNNNFHNISLDDIRRYINVNYSVKLDVKNVNYLYGQLKSNQNFNTF